MPTIAVYSLKGGVGKTTLAVNLAWCSATLSARRTLLWDLDPQAASTFLLGEPKGKDRAQAIFTRDVDPARSAHPSRVANLDLIDADASLRNLDLLFHEIDKKKRLAKLLAGVARNYDHVLLDCPPGLTPTAEQVIRAADLIVVPVVPSPLSERAFAEMAQHLGKTEILPVLTMVDRRRALHREAIARHPDWPVVPMASVIETMAAKRMPVGAFAPRTPAAAAFAGLWQAIERRLAG